MNGYKGMINLDYAFKNKHVRFGPEEAQEFFDRRLVVPIDPGTENLAGMLFMIGISI